MKQEQLFNAVKEINHFHGSRHFIKEEFESHIRKKNIPYSNQWFPELRKRKFINAIFGKYSLVKVTPSDVITMYDTIKTKIKRNKNHED